VISIITAGVKDYAKAGKELMDRLKPGVIFAFVSASERLSYLSEIGCKTLPYKDIRMVMPSVNIVTVCLDDQNVWYQLEGAGIYVRFYLNEF
jgi:hypothetical protein